MKKEDIKIGSTVFYSGDYYSFLSGKIFSILDIKYAILSMADALLLELEMTK